MIWEAQYGDFINGAQVEVDEFVTSARAKWGQTPSLVLLLPTARKARGRITAAAVSSGFSSLWRRPTSGSRTAPPLG